LIFSRDSIILLKIEVGVAPKNQLAWIPTFWLWKYFFKFCLMTSHQWTPRNILRPKKGNIFFGQNGKKQHFFLSEWFHFWYAIPYQ
jgi:hypothetical protein